MPTYNFKCRKHGYFNRFLTLEEYDEFRENNFAGLCLKDECDKELDVVIGNPPVHFNADGFYCTDNKTEGDE